MPAYHQMGHHSDNLLVDDQLQSYAGAVLSPVNYGLDQTRAQVASHTGREFETILDPQLYVPTSERGQLRTWSYFPADVDSADLTSVGWWRSVVSRLAEVAFSVAPSSVCTPAIVPRAFNVEYFALMTEVGEMLRERLSQSRIETLQTLIVGLGDLTQRDRALEIASVASRTGGERIYLVLVSDVEPRREVDQTEELKGALRLIESLERSGLHVLVSHCSSDVLLWKAAGATACATGKFFNLRRFTRSRYEEPSSGGGQLPYLFEEDLVAFLRETDVTRVRDAGALSAVTLANPFAAEILQILQSEPGKPWLGLAWRQYMYWFADAEARLSRGALVTESHLQDAEKRWRELGDRRPPVLMEEMRNDGAWLRAWRRALVEFRS